LFDSKSQAKITIGLGRTVLFIVNYLGTHLFVKVPRPRDSKGTFSVRFFVVQ